MTFLSRALSRIGRRAPLRSRVFANPNFIRIPVEEKVEEETLPDYLPARYYPVRIGEVFVDRYQIVGKLGFGASSTVWLARDLTQHRHVALKVFIRSQALGEHVGNEMAMYKRMEQCSSNHPGRDAVRTLLDSFRINGPDGEHLFLAHPPLGRSIEGAISRTSPKRLPPSGLRFVLRNVFLALDYLHNECQIIHTDIKADNIMFSISDQSVFNDFEEEEIHDPSPWDYKIDIWNVGCMAWDIFEGSLLFHGIDPEHLEYRRRAHIAEIITVLGPPLKDLLARGDWSSKLFSKEGKFIAGFELPAPTSLEELEAHLSGEEQQQFLVFMRKMLQWAPERRSTAKELGQDAWLQKPL